MQALSRTCKPLFGPSPVTGEQGWPAPSVRGAILIIALCALIGTDARGAGLYKWIGENGEVTYSQFPPPDKQAETIKPPPKVDTEKAREELKERSERANEYVENAKKATAARQDKEKEAAELAQKCQRVRDNLFMLERRNRLYQTDAQGNRIRVGEEQRQAEIKQAKEQLAEHCK